jgi:hypothetical protein
VAPKRRSRESLCWQRAERSILRSSIRESQSKKALGDAPTEDTMKQASLKTATQGTRGTAVAPRLTRLSILSSGCCGLLLPCRPERSLHHH